MNSVKPVLGTMNFGPQVTTEESLKMVDSFLSSGFQEVDTAYVYNDGDSEKFLGKALQKVKPNDAIIATKVNPRVSGKLDKVSVEEQLLESLVRLQRTSVDILYLHFPDPTTPLSETLKCCSDLYNKGYFKELGLSNYSASQVSNVWNICNENGWILPTVYQGLYNALSRAVELELMPVLRDLDIRFYAYNPLAGGILSGKYTDIQHITPGRFTHRPNYKGRYWRKEFFDALTVLNQACKNSGVTVLEASYRWLIECSHLDGTKGDGVLIGSSSVSQLHKNLSFFRNSDFDKSVFEVFELAWKISQEASPPYFRTVGGGL